MGVKVHHVFGEPDQAPAVIRAEFDRQLSEREASEIAQAISGIHERHEAARDFAANDPHHRRHLSRRVLEGMVGAAPDVDEQGQPVIHPGSGEQTITRTFAGACKDCGRPYVAGAAEPFHYVCPTLPTETNVFVRFRETPCHERCAIDCGRDAEGQVTRDA